MWRVSKPTYFGILAITGLVLSVASKAFDILSTLWAVVAVVTFLVLLALSLWAEMVPDWAQRVAALRVHTIRQPALVLRVLIGATTLATLILVIVQHGTLVHIDTSIDERSAETTSCTRTLHIESMDAEKGGTYRAGDDYPQVYTDGGRVGLTPLPWERPETLGKKSVLAFSYYVIPGRERRQSETSGVYVTFYDDPLEFSRFDALSFSIRGEGGGDNQAVDLGVRLVLDDPSLPRLEREITIRQMPSLQKLGYFSSGHWERVSIDLAEFDLLLLSGRAERVEGDSINKIVFFVDNDILERSSKGTIRIKDIRFERYGDQCSSP